VVHPKSYLFSQGSYSGSYSIVGEFMTEQNRKYITKEIGKLLSETWRIKSLAEQEYGPQHPITKKLAGVHEDIQKLLREY
jgi:hypothetical protein